MKTTVGRFSYDPETEELEGPAEYMEERGNARVERILAGEDVVFNMGAVRSPDPITAMLVSLQTDYAGWKGTKTLFAGLKNGKE